MSGFVCDFAYLEPWIDPDHLAFTVYRARKDGKADGRSTGDTMTLPVKFVLEAETLDQCRSDMLDLHDEPVMDDEIRRYYEAVFERAVSLNWMDDLRDIYPIARDYVMDHIHERDLFVQMQRDKHEAEKDDPRWQWLTPLPR